MKVIIRPTPIMFKKAKQIAALEERCTSLENALAELTKSAANVNDVTNLSGRLNMVEEIANHTDKELLRTQTTTKQLSLDLDSHRQFTHNQDEALRLHNGVVSEIKVGLYELGQKIAALADALSMEFSAGPNGQTQTAKKVKKPKNGKAPELPVPTMESFVSKDLGDRVLDILNSTEPTDVPDAASPKKRKAPAKKTPPKKAKARPKKKK